MSYRIFYIIFILLLNFGCSKNIEKKVIVLEKDLNNQVLEAYKEGFESLNAGDVLYAAKKFNEAEILFPQSDWAPKSSLMAAYAYYSDDYYGDAIAELDRFIKVYPKNPNLDYAYYLLGICFYEQIIDEKKDLQSIMSAKKNFEILLNKYPNTEYALDAEFKMDLIDDVLASKEMFIGRYYVEKKKWVPAINRFSTVVNDYDTTIYIEEALYRLVEIYYLLGLTDESKKYANLLGYNYQSSEWYENSYSIFNEKYKIQKRNQLKKQKSIIKKIKSLFN